MSIIYDAKELFARYPVPAPIVPHGIQIEDIEAGIRFGRVGVFLPVGYGKTFITTYIALGWDNEFNIVVVPPILVLQWVRWLNSIPDAGRAVAYNDKSPARRRELPLRSFRWWVMSYGLFKNDFAHLVKMLGSATYSTLVDEAQGLKNSNSQLFKHVNTFSAGRNLQLSTGTEMSKPDDAYAYIALKNPGIYRSLAHFENLHVAERDFFKKPIRWQGLDVVHQNLYLNSLHRTKEEVHKHLPQPNYIKYTYDLSPEHRAFYDEIAEQLIKETEEGGKIDGTTPAKLRNTLQQLILSWPDFTGNPDHRPAFYDHLDEWCDEIDVRNEAASKFIIWTWFKRSTENVWRYLNETMGIKTVAAYSGANSIRSVEAFMGDPKTRILVAQPGSAGAGLNPQYICWEMAFAEIPTTSIPFRQSAGRIDREGQRFRPNIRIAMASGTVQTGMYASLLNNDGVVQKVQGNAFDLRKLVYG